MRFWNLALQPKSGIRAFGRNDVGSTAPQADICRTWNDVSVAAVVEYGLIRVEKVNRVRLNRNTGSEYIDAVRDELRLSNAGVGIEVFNRSFTDDNHDGRADLVFNFRTSEALRAALTSMYADLLQEDYEDDGVYDRKQDALIALDGVFGDLGQEFQGSDSAELFLAGKSLKTLLASLGI